MLHVGYAEIGYDRERLREQVVGPMPVDVSVVIPAYNAEAFIGQCLRGLRNQVFPGGIFEVIVVDDGSTDDTADLAQKLGKELQLSGFQIFRQANAGPASARNQGIRLAQGDIIVFLDSDCIPQAGWLEVLAESFRETPSLVGVEGRTLPEPGPRTLMDHYIDNPNGGYYWTCNMAYRKEALLSIGGFDEGFPLASGEDIDLAHRMQQFGPLGFAPGALVHHLVLPRSFARHLRTARTFSSMIRLHRKHLGLLTREPHFSRLVLYQLKALLFPIITRRREFPKSPPIYLKFCLLQLLMTLDTLVRLPQYYRQASGPLVVRQPLTPESKPDQAA